MANPKPAGEPASPLVMIDNLTIEPHPAIINVIERKIWNPYHGYGRLVGSIGTPPVYAHVAYYPGRRPERQLTPQHCGAFFVLN